MVNSKKNVFLVVCVPGQAVEIMEIARILLASKDFFPIIYFNLGNVEITPLMSDILNAGIDIFDYNLGSISANISIKDQKESVTEPIRDQTVVEAPVKILTWKQQIKINYPRLFSVIKWIVGTYYGILSLFLRQFSFVHYVVRKIQRLKKETEILKKMKVKLLILAEDSEGYFTPQLIHSAHKLSIKSVVFPYTFANQFEFLEDAYFNNQSVDQSFFGFLVAKMFPKWSCRYKGKNLLRWRPDVIFAAELFGKTAPNPWVMNSGFADVIAVESSFMLNYYAKAGILKEQMLETGFVSLDNLSHSFKEREKTKLEMSKRYGLSLEKPWLLCAVPPSQWPRAGIGFSSYEELLVSLIGFLKTFSDIEVILKFHPRIRDQEAESLCQRFEVPYIGLGTSHLIGVADMYVASVSATMRWALACSIPTINYDLYAFRYDDFNQVKGLYTMETFNEFKRVFSGIHDQVITSFTKKEIKIGQAEFGQLDGKCGERILSLFRHLTEGN